MSKKFLICQLASFGDCLYATTIAKQIKHDYPDSHLTWAISSRYKSVLDNNPDVDSVWEIPSSYGDLFTDAWYRLVKEALERKEKGEFDEIIFSQTTPRWTHFNGTLRGTILSTYGRPITVSPRPVIVLSKEEVSHVEEFCLKNKVESYKNVVLFECAPTSGQSKDITPEFALRLSEQLLESEPNTCIILSSPRKLDAQDKRIIDASELTFRENAELANHCTLFIGCSSGITWLLTSEWTKPLLMIELLDRNFPVFYGVKYDHELQGLPHENILEIATFSEEKIRNTILLALAGKWTEATDHANEEYRVTYDSFRHMVILFLKYKHPIASVPLLFRYRKIHHLSLGMLFIHLLYGYTEFAFLAIKKAAR
jgi:hypothetical protein